jgi:hypothetical protein
VIWRTLGTDLQEHGTLKDAQGALRHASIQTIGDVDVQTIEASVLNAMNSRITEILSAPKTEFMTRAKAMMNEPATSKRRSLRIMKKLDQLGPSSEGSTLVSN